MDCRGVQDDLEAYVLGALGPERRAEVEGHLAGCWACRAAEAELRAILGEIRAGAGVSAVRPAFERRLRAAVAAGIARERRRRMVRRAALAAAAAVVAAVGAMVWAPRRAQRPWAMLGEQWRFEAARATPASAADRVVVRGGAMFLLTSGRPAEVVAVATRSGRVLWRSAVGATGYLAADDERVYCIASGRDGHLALVALHAKSGRPLWRHAVERAGLAGRFSRPVPLAGGRVSWSVGRVVRVVDARSGRLVWAFRAPGGPVSAARLVGDRVFVATGAGLHCLSASDGSRLWSLALGGGGSALAPPLLAADDARVYVARRLARGNGEALAVDLKARKVVWRWRGCGARDLVAHGGRLLLRGPREVVALDARGGTRLWRYRASGCGPLSVFDGVVCFVDSSGAGRLVALDVAAGAEVGCIGGIRSCDGLTAVGRTAFLKTNDGVVHAIVSSRLFRS